MKNEETNQGTELKNFGIEKEIQGRIKVKEEKEEKERMLIVEALQCEEEEMDESEVNLNTLKRDNYTKEQWQQIVKEIKKQRQIVRQTCKKSKNQKEKERKLARKKNHGK